MQRKLKNKRDCKDHLKDVQLKTCVFIKKHLNSVVSKEVQTNWKNKRECKDHLKDSHQTYENL